MSAHDTLHPMLHDMGDPAWRQAFADRLAANERREEDSLLLDNMRTERLWDGELLIPGHPDLMEIPLLGTTEVAYIRKGMGT